MHARRLGQRLVIAIQLLGLILLIASVLVLGMAIWHGTAGLPTVDVQYSTNHIVAYTTHDPECPPFTVCPLLSVAPPYAYYAVWIIRAFPTTAQPQHRTTRRLLAMPLPQ